MVKGFERKIIMNTAVEYYDIGALLYCPANNPGIADSIINERFGTHFSLALCLEDTINDACVAEAENQLVLTINKIFSERFKKPFYVPKIFIRVRNVSQISDLLNRFGSSKELIKGFILPKFCLHNADEYINTISDINSTSNQKIYMLPILESADIVNLQNRYSILYQIKEKLSSIEELVLNIRVGGNDLCHLFGFRRNDTQSIHQIKPISGIFSDIVTVFGMDYVISGPVWEYYSSSNWENGLKNELADDRLCGFIGKTVIHPKQIPIINNAYQVSQKDFDDAKSILNWDISSNSFVSGSVAKERMNEYKTHSNWAFRTMMLAEAFGIRS